MQLSRNFTNVFNWVLDQLIPPFIRDSRIIMSPLFYLLFGNKYKRFMDFKNNVLNLDKEGVVNYYKELLPYHISRETDLNEECITHILDNIKGDSILDISCGTGYLAKRIFSKHQIEVVGIDFIISEELKKIEQPKFIEATIENIPYPDNYFDDVVCAHTLEHVVDIKKAVDELRRVCSGKLTIILPKQRNYKYTFDLHIHFFPYKYSVLNLMENKGTCICLKNDWVYEENVSAT